MPVAPHRVDRRRRPGVGERVALLDRHRVLEAHGEGHPLEQARARLGVRLLDCRVDLGRRAVIAALRAARDQHRLHQGDVAQQTLDGRRLLGALSRELREPLRRGVGQQRATHQLVIPLLATQESLGLLQGRRRCGRLIGLRLRQRGLRRLPGRRQARLVLLRRRQGRLPFGQGLQALLAVRLPLRQVLVRRGPLRLGRRLLQGRLGGRDALGRAPQPLPVGVVDQRLGRRHLPERLLGRLRVRLGLRHRGAGLQQGRPPNLGQGRQTLGDLRLQAREHRGVLRLEFLLLRAPGHRRSRGGGRERGRADRGNDGERREGAKEGEELGHGKVRGKRGPRSTTGCSRSESYRGEVNPPSPEQGVRPPHGGLTPCSDPVIRGSPYFLGSSLTLMEWSDPLLLYSAVPIRRDPDHGRVD